MIRKETMPLADELKDSVENSALSTKVYEVLREQIVKHKLHPGEKLNIYALAKLLGVSRSPIKEAFNRLSTEGLITIYPHKGTYVRSTMGPKEIEDLFGVRLMIELWGVEAALKDVKSLDLERMADLLHRCDPLFSAKDSYDYSSFFKCDHEFHTVIVDSAKNARLGQLYKSLGVHIQILKALWGRHRAQALRSHKEHHQIFEAFRKDSSDIKRRLIDHIETSKSFLLSLGTDQPLGDSNKNSSDEQAPIMEAIS